jgi:hypothetical protein
MRYFVSLSLLLWVLLPVNDVDTVMRYFVSLSLLLWVLLPVNDVEGLTFPINPFIEIRPAPLISGPSWLPLHCQVVLGQKTVFDFVPINATQTETLQKLLALQSVPAVARIRTEGSEDVNRFKTSKLVDRAVVFCQEYDRDLHLVYNNCWTFAYDLVWYILFSSDEDIK